MVRKFIFHMKSLKPKKPKAKSPAHRLREAAIAWVSNMKKPPVDSEDSEFFKLDKKLLEAAIIYSESRK